MGISKLCRGGGRVNGSVRKIQLIHTYENIISLENLYLAWQEFILGKKSKVDVQIFERNLMDNILKLHSDLVNKTYRHGGYESFFVNDPKRRHIHKASVCDRLLHHAVYRVLYPFFGRTFIADSFSCRIDKGVHKVLKRIGSLALKVSHNHTRTCWILKCDIKSFFASIDHERLIEILKEYIHDPQIISFLKNIIGSFCTDGKTGVGLPLGNLTSQLFSNVYMNKFDVWVKHSLKAKHYLRYADDFVFLSHDKKWFESIIPKIEEFLWEELKLKMHPDKVSIKTIASGVDFLGWVHFENYRVLRNKTKQRMFRKIIENGSDKFLQSYFGLLQHGNTDKLRKELEMVYWILK